MARTVFAGYDAAADGGLDGHLEHLPRDGGAQFFHQAAALGYRVVPVD